MTIFSDFVELMNYFSTVMRERERERGGEADRVGERDSELERERERELYQSYMTTIIAARVSLMPHSHLHTLWQCMFLCT